MKNIRLILTLVFLVMLAFAITACTTGSDTTNLNYTNRTGGINGSISGGNGNNAGSVQDIPLATSTDVFNRIDEAINYI